MRNHDVFTKLILTLIAGLLAVNTVARFRVPVAHAQPASYSVEKITTDWKHYQTSFEAAINTAAKGRELVTVFPFDQPGGYLAVYKQQAR